MVEAQWKKIDNDSLETLLTDNDTYHNTTSSNYLF